MKRRRKLSKEECLSGIAKVFAEAIEQIMRENGVTKDEAGRMLGEGLNNWSRAQRFGTMPQDYDPAKDEFHPMRGWRPDR